MKFGFGLMVLVVLAQAAWAADDPYASLCSANPAFSVAVMRSIIDEQLRRDHDPALDIAAPEKLAEQAAAQGIADCAGDMRREPNLYQAIAGLPEQERGAGWDAYNSACGDHHGTKGDCVRAEIGAMRALKRLSATNSPSGARALVQTCSLVLQTEAPMADWRECVDLGLAVHAAPDSVDRCRLSLSWHVSKTGAQAGRSVAQCLQGAAR